MSNRIRKRITHSCIKEKLYYCCLLTLLRDKITVLNELKSQKSGLEKLTKTINELTKSSFDLSTDIFYKENEISNLKTTIHEMSQNTQDLMNEVKSFTCYFQISKDKLDEYTDTIDDLTNLNNKFQEENSTKEQEINSLKDSIVLLDKKEELNAVKQKVVDLCFEIDELNNQIEQQNR